MSRIWLTIGTSLHTLLLLQTYLLFFWKRLTWKFCFYWTKRYVLWSFLPSSCYILPTLFSVQCSKRLCYEFLLLLLFLFPSNLELDATGWVVSRHCYGHGNKRTVLYCQNICQWMNMVFGAWTKLWKILSMWWGNIALESSDVFGKELRKGQPIYNSHLPRSISRSLKF